MSLADFLRGNLPSVEEPDEVGSDAPSFPVKWKTTSVTIPEDEHTIFAAVRYNDTQRIEQLLRQSVDVNIVHGTTSCLLRKSKVQKSVAMQLNEYTPLHVACLHSTIEVIRLLLERHADVNMKDSTNRTALHYATLANRPDVVHLCIEHGADVNLQTSSGKTALMYAVQEKNLPIVITLLNAGADVTLKDVKGGSAIEICLLSAGRTSNAKIVKALLEAGSDPNAENLSKATPLMLAAGTGQLDVISLLLEAGVDINHEDNKGKTAFDICCEHTRMTKAGRLLLSRGADINHKDHSVVTGSSEGIGKAYARELAKRGVNVILISRGENRLYRTAEEIEKDFNVQTCIIALDFNLGRDVYPTIWEKIKDKEIGILVNNVGVMYDHPQYFLDVPEERLWQIINVNVAAATMMTHMIMPQMVERGRGAVVMVSSGSCSQITPQMTVYAATKSFLDYFARALDFEYRSKGIIVQSLMPFYVATKMTRFSHTLSKPSLLIPSAEKYAASAVATLGYTSRTSGYWPHTVQAWFANLIPEWLWMKGATGLNNALRRQAEQRRRLQTHVRRDSSELDISKFS
ncbi:uncharacterized protein LOC111105370 [Crassostrea virginica]